MARKVRAVRQLDLLVIVVDRRFREQLEFERFEVGFAKLAQPLAVRLGLFLGGAEQGAGDDEQFAVEAGRSPSSRVYLWMFSARTFWASAMRSQALRVLLERFVFPGLGAQPFFLVLLAGHQLRIEQGGQAADARLAAVLHAEQ